MRVLIVEDDHDAGRLLSTHLNPLGECEVVENGNQAVAAFRKSFRERYPFDLVCLDIMMPQKDGHQTLKELREIEQVEGLLVGEGSKVLMTSALSDNKNILQSFMELCDGYLVKPFSKRDLLDKLREIEVIGEEDSGPRAAA